MPCTLRGHCSMKPTASTTGIQETPSQHTGRLPHMPQLIYLARSNLKFLPQSLIRLALIQISFPTFLFHPSKLGLVPPICNETWSCTSQLQASLMQGLSAHSHKSFEDCARSATCRHGTQFSRWGNIQVRVCLLLSLV